MPFLSTKWYTVSILIYQLSPDEKTPSKRWLLVSVNAIGNDLPEARVPHSIVVFFLGVLLHHLRMKLRSSCLPQSFCCGTVEAEFALSFGAHRWLVSGSWPQCSSEGKSLICRFKQYLAHCDCGKRSHQIWSKSMVVVMEASVCGEAPAGAVASNHRAWYEATAGSNPPPGVSSAASSTASTAAAAASSSEQLDAYFKGSNATTAAYFSQMQAGAYPGMSYHGN